MSNQNSRMSEALHTLAAKYSSFVISESNTLDDNITAIIAKGIRKCSRGATSSLLRDEARDRVLAIDQSLPHDSAAAVDYGSFERNSLFNEVRRLLSRWCSDFSINFDEAWGSPGETFDPLYGEVSMHSKLSSEWTVTPEAYDLGIKLMLSNRQVRREVAKDVKATGLAAKEEFYELFYKRFKLVRGSRFSAVPKDETKMRGIEVQPLVNLMLQRCFHTWAAKKLRKLGIPLEDAKERHQGLLSRNDIRTIDAKDASDRISMRLVRDLFPTNVVRFIDETRARYCRWDKHEESWLPLRKVSGMGSYITFALMTLLLAAICEACGSTTYSVFGDDVIVDADHFETVICGMETAGFVINYDKTFSKGILRESCGLYVSHETPILRYDFTWCEDDLDLVMALNKASRLIREYEGFNLPIISDLKSWYESCDRDILPQGPILADLSPWVEIPNHTGVPDRVLSKRYQLNLTKVKGLVRTVYASFVEEGNHLDYTIFLKALSKPVYVNVKRKKVSLQSFIIDADAATLLGSRQSLKREIRLSQSVENFRTNWRS